MFTVLGTLHLARLQLLTRHIVYTLPNCLLFLRFTTTPRPATFRPSAPIQNQKLGGFLQGRSLSSPVQQNLNNNFGFNSNSIIPVALFLEQETTTEQQLPTTQRANFFAQTATFRPATTRNNFFGQTTTQRTTQQRLTWPTTTRTQRPVTTPLPTTQQRFETTTFATTPRPPQRFFTTTFGTTTRPPQRFFTTTATTTTRRPTTTSSVSRRQGKALPLDPLDIPRQNNAIFLGAKIEGADKDILDIAPYKFSYDVGTHYHHEESDADRKIVRGKYGILDANGILREIEYYVDETGFHPIVRRKNLRALAAAAAASNQ